MTTAYPDPRYGAMPPPPPGPPPPPAKKELNPLDVTLGIVLYSVALVLAACSAYATVFFAFAADSCSYGGKSCDYVGSGMGASWGGAALAVVTGAVMLPIAAWRRWPLWIWGVVPLILVIGGFLIGYSIVSAGISA
ncbi:hypothetical protein [Nocardia sp. NPDC057227]|uniref:hypothetical protein n=1 Tax=Nocardia sp. NPDC057227 TaxID=3346056 RepID=UPI00362E7462